jgi:hypothetical protein
MRFFGLASGKQSRSHPSSTRDPRWSARRDLTLLGTALLLVGCGRIGIESLDVTGGTLANAGAAGFDAGPGPGEGVGGRSVASTGGDAGASSVAGAPGLAGSAGNETGLGGMPGDGGTSSGGSAGLTVDAGGAAGTAGDGAGGVAGTQVEVGGASSGGSAGATAEVGGASDGGSAGATAGVGGASNGGAAGAPAGGGAAGAGILDDDGDGVPNDEDLCPGWDDNADADGDGVPDGCDTCAGAADPVVPADWWNDQYDFRLPLTITESISGSLASGYTVQVTLDTQSLIQASRLLTDGADLRVVWQDGGAEVELDRHVVGIDTASTEIWFKTQASITDSDTSYAIYYGNSTATNPPAHWSDAMGTGATPSAVYLAGDDFETETLGTIPGGWEGSSAYAVALDGGNQVLELQSFDPDADYLFAGDYAWGDVVVSARVSIQDTSGEYYGLFLKVQPGTNFYTTYYGTSSNTSTLQVWDMTIASPTAHGASTNSRRSTGVSPSLDASWHTLRVAMLGQDLHFFYDDQPELYTYSVLSSRVQGRIGLCVGYADGHAYWDDVIVRAYVSPEPAVAEGSAESIACP